MSKILQTLRKLTMKQLMLIIMSTLLVLMVLIAVIVVGEVMDMLAAFLGDPNTPSTGESTTQQTSTTASESTSETTTAPTETDPEESTEPHVHEYVKDKTTAATCTSMGYTVYKCSCGKTDVRDFREQLGHQYQQTKVEQTCEQDGCTMKSCVRCGDVQKTDVVPALGHDYQTVKTVTADCEQEGYEEKECTRCHEVVKENIQPALGHSYGEWEEIKAATETAPGAQRKACGTCGHEETEIIPATGDFKINSTAMSNDNEAWTYYRIQVGTKNTPYAYTFSIYIGLENRNITYVYSKVDGLVVRYTGADGTQLQEKLDAYADGVLTIDKDGMVSTKAPSVAPAAPTDPSTQPSEGEQQPTENGQSSVESKDADRLKTPAATEPTKGVEHTAPVKANT